MPRDLTPRTVPAATGAGHAVNLGQANSNRGLPSYAPVASAQRWDASRGVYNYKSSNTRNLDQGMSNAMIANGPVGGMTEWLWVGDSASAGANSTVGTIVFDRLRAVPLATRDALANMGVPAAGPGFIRYVDNTWTDARHVYTGTWTNTLATTFSNTVASTITTTVDRYATQVDVWYYAQAASGTFTISVNGVTSGTGFATVATAGTVGWRRYRMSGVTLHPGSTIKVTLTVAGTGVYLSGVCPFVPNGGLIVHNVAQSSSQTGGSTSAKNWEEFTAGGLGNVYLQLAYGWRNVTDASFTDASASITSATAAFTNDDVGKPIEVASAATGKAVPGQAYIVSVTSSTVAVMNQPANQTMTGQTVRIGRPPSVLHLELGLNDLWNGRTVAQVIASLKTIRNQFPTSAQGTDVVLHMFGEMAYSYVSQATQEEWWTAMYALADELDCPLYDWRDRMGSYAQGQASNTYGDFFAHPTAATAADIGASLAMVIGGGSGLPQSALTPTRPEDVVNKRTLDGRVTIGKQATTSVTTTAQTALTTPVRIPANSFAVGSAIDVDAIYKSAVGSVGTARIHIGPLGTTADPSMTIAVGTSQVNTQRMDGLACVQAVGASGSINGSGVVFASTTSNIPATAPAGLTFDTTKDNFVTLSLANGTSTTTTVYAAILRVNL